MEEKKSLWNLSVDELNALAQEAVRQAVAENHANGLSTYACDEEGNLVETRPCGRKKILKHAHEMGVW